MRSFAGNSFLQLIARTRSISWIVAVSGAASAGVHPWANSSRGARTPVVVAIWVIRQSNTRAKQACHFKRSTRLFIRFCRMNQGFHAASQSKVRTLGVATWVCLVPSSLATGAGVLHHSSRTCNITALPHVWTSHVIICSPACSKIKSASVNEYSKINRKLTLPTGHGMQDEPTRCSPTGLVEILKSQSYHQVESSQKRVVTDILNMWVHTYLCSYKLMIHIQKFTYIFMCTYIYPYTYACI